MWCASVKFGGDSGAVRQVSDIGGGFERDSFTVRSRPCHGIRVKREIIIGAASLRTKGGGESFVSARRFLDPRIGTSLRRMRVCRICVELASPAGVDRRRCESRLIRPPTDISAHRPPAAGRVRVFPRASAPLAGGACFRVLRKNRKIQESVGGLHGSTETRSDVSCRWPTGGLRRAPVA